MLIENVKYKSGTNTEMKPVKSISFDINVEELKDLKVKNGEEYSEVLWDILHTVIGDYLDNI